MRQPRNKGDVSLLVLVGIVLLETGCSLIPGRIKAKGVTVQGVKDAGSPAILAASSAGTVIPLPVGSRVVVTKETALAAVPATKDAPAVAAVPAKEVTEVFPAGPTEYRKTEETVRADTGTVDTSIAARRIDAEENRPLLYGALALAVACGAFFWLKYPSPALMCAAGSVILFLAWKVSGLPQWFWGLAVLAGGGGVGLYLGHNRGLHEPVPPKN